MYLSDVISSTSDLLDEVTLQSPIGSDFSRKDMPRPSFMNEKQAIRVSQTRKDKSQVQIDQYHLYNPSE